MIDPKAVTTYAQYNEDIILNALLHDVEEGFYIDVGANYPTIDSVTKLFYDKGWSGINVEPIEGLYEQLKAERARDINLHCGMGETPAVAQFREYVDAPGHSTFEREQKQTHTKDAYKDYDVPIKTLKQVFAEAVNQPVHFIKIDVEGYEYQVVAGNDWSVNRPEVVCIEANHVSQDWRPLFQQHKYKLFISDGLNEYYIAEEAWGRTDGFAERIILLDYHALKQHQQQSWDADSKELQRLHQVAQQVDDLEHEVKRLQELEPLTLKNQPFRHRLKRAAYGLTVDWIHFKQR